MHENNQTLKGLIDLTAGSLGGCANVLVGQPLDTVKVKMQTFPELYPSSWNCFKKTLTKDGLFRGLYAGTNPALIANIAENSVLFCAYGFCQNALVEFCSKSKSNILVKQSMNKNEKKYSLTPLGNACAGFLAAFFSSFTLCPTELIKCKLQAAHETGKKNLTTFSLTKSILKNEGILGLFRGLTSTMAREMPGYFCFFGGIEMTKSILSFGNEDNENLLIKITAGGVGGICLWTAIFPFDVCKSKIQVESLKDPMYKVMKNIIKTNGISGLYNGLLPTLIRTFPSTGALFVTYEYSKDFLTYQLNRN